MAETATELQMWEKTNDKVGIRPTQDIYCPICAHRDPPIKSKMVMRRSRIHTVADVRITRRNNDPNSNVRPYACDVAFKCPVCDYYCIFGVPLPMEYAQKVIEMRGGSIDFVLPEDVWEQDDRIVKKMEGWGYW